MSYGWFGDAGTIVSSVSAARSGGSALSTRGGSSTLLPGMNDSSSRMSSRHSWSFSAAKCATPLRSLCVIAPPSSSFVTCFVRDGADHVGPGHEHVAGVLHHDGEVGDRRRIDGAAGAGSHDRGDLRHHARRQRVAKKDVGVAAERHDAFLDPRAARVVQADDGRPHLHGQVHDLHDLRRVGLGQRPAEDGEVLRERIRQPAVDPSVAADDAVARHDLLGHAEVGAAVGDELVDFFERAGVEQQVDALARGQLAGVALAAETILAPAQLGAPLEIGQVIVMIHPGARPWPPAPSPSPSGSVRGRCR